MLIYMVTNKVNDKSYIGQTIQSLEERRRHHISDAFHKNNGMYIGRSIRKHGADNFVWKILHNNITNVENLNRLEIFYIGYYNTFEDGYNLNEGGNNATHTSEVRKKMSEAQLGEKNHRFGKKSPMYGKKHSEDSKRKMSESHKNRAPVSDEFRKKISEITKGRKWSEGHRRKMSGKNNPAARVVVVNGKYFNTIKESAEYLNIHRETISRRIKNQKPGYQYACQKEATSAKL